MSNVSAFGGRGFGIIEIIIVIAILAGAMFAFAQMATISLKALREEKKVVEASYLAQEAIEAVRAVRDSGWTPNISDLLAGGDYHPEISGSQWVLTSGVGTVGEYSRKVVVDNVSRDGNDDIESGYNPVNDDPNTKKLTATVSWGAKNIVLMTYITNF